MPIFQMLSQTNQTSIEAVIAAKGMRGVGIDEAVLDLAKTDGGEFQLPLKSDASGPFTVKPNMPLLPYFPKGHHVTLKNWWSSENGVDCYLRAQNGEQRTPDSRAENEDGTGVNGQSLPPRSPLQSRGQLLLILPARAVVRLRLQPARGASVVEVGVHRGDDSARNQRAR